MAKQKEVPTFRGGMIAAGIYALTAALLILQPDFGMTVVMTAIYGTQLFLAGLPMILVIGLAVLAVVGGFGAYVALDHVRSRIDRFLDPTSGDNYQVQKSMEAFQNGGLLGTGAGQGEVKLSLPDAHADFTFAVAGEEMGVWFAIVLVALFAFVLLRGFNRLMDNDDLFCVLATAGLLVMFGMQALVHMGSSLHLLPAKGMTLPFVSYGGSSMVAISFAMGSVLALTRRKVRRGIAKGSIVTR
jgi:cell division protein FtsW